MRTVLEKKVIWSVVALALTVVLVLAAIIFPTAKQILAINSETQELLKNIEIRYENAKNIRNNLNKTKDIQEDVAGFNKFIFNRDNGLELITTLEAFADKNNVSQKIDNSNFDDTKAKYVNLSLTLRGAYGDIFRYLLDLENSNYFININNINLTPAPSPQAGGQSAVNMRLNINIYAGK